MKSKSVVMGVWLVACFLPGGAGAGGKFVPDASKVVPLAGGSYDLDLLRAGKPADRFARAEQLAATLPPLSDVDPMNQVDQMLGWVAVTTLMEAAVADADRSQEEWEVALVDTYRIWAGGDVQLGMFRAAMTMVAMQPGGDSHPMVRAARQLAGMPVHARQGIRWLAERRLRHQPGKPLRKALLDGLVQVHRRAADWNKMHMAAVTLSDLEASGEHAAWEAEALCELGRLGRADKALQRALGKGAPETSIERARARCALERLRRALKEKPEDPGRMAAVARALLELEEPWRVIEAFPRERILCAAHPALDEVTIRALMGGGLNYREAWSFGKQARGRPPTKKFLAHRIGAGLMMIMEDFYRKQDLKQIDREVFEVVESDLQAFRKADAHLADLTGLSLRFMRFVTEQQMGEEGRQKLRQAVEVYRERYPADLAGVQVDYLLAQLFPGGTDPWDLVGAYRRALGNQPAPPAFVSVFAGAALRKAVDGKSIAPLATVIKWIDGHSGDDRSAAMMLWRAHLLAVQGLLSPEQDMGKRLQQAVDAYGGLIRGWQGGGASAGSPEQLCDAITSVATLLMQGRSLDEARQLVAGTRPVCGERPAAAALDAVLRIASGDKTEGEPDPVAALEKLIPRLASAQAQIQAHLWLARQAQAQEKPERASAQLGAAAALVRDERARGKPAVLAPDLRSLVAFSGSFNLSAGYSTGSPFGLAVQVEVTTRMILFPPASVDEASLTPYLQAGKE